MNVMAIDLYDFGYHLVSPGIDASTANSLFKPIDPVPLGRHVSSQLIKNGFLKIGDTLTTRMNGSVIYWVVATVLSYLVTIETGGQGLSHHGNFI